MAPMYYRGATAAVIVFDASKYRAWDTMEIWHKASIWMTMPRYNTFESHRI